MEIPRAPAVLVDTVVGWLWDELPDPVPHASYEARWSPVLVLSHDCEIEKEFNERVIDLISGGMPEEAATLEASADPTLDPFAVVAPLLPYPVFAEHQFNGIRTGQRIGVVPIDQLPGDGGDYVVELFRPCVVSVMLLPQDMKVASMAPHRRSRARRRARVQRPERSVFARPCRLGAVALSSAYFSSTCGTRPHLLAAASSEFRYL